MSATSADYEDLLLGKPDQLDTRAADLVTAADAIEQATAALRGLIDDQTSLSTDALAETASEVARSLSKARTRYRKTGQALQTYAADLRPIQSDARSAISSAEYYEQRSASLPRDISAREGDLLRALAVDPRLEGRVQSVVTAGSAVDKHASDMDPSIRVTQVNNIWDPVHHLELVGYDPEDDVAGPNWQTYALIDGRIHNADMYGELADDVIPGVRGGDEIFFADDVSGTHEEVYEMVYSRG